jgi:hypothetical protein
MQLQQADVDALKQGAVVVHIVNTSNADVDAAKAFSIISQLPQQDLQVNFEVEQNQVAYRDDWPLTVKVNVTAEQLQAPAAVRYTSCCFT